MISRKMPKRKSPEVAEGKDASKVTKQEPIRRSERLSSKPAPSKPEIKPEIKPKKAVSKPVEDKGAKGKKGGPKGKKEDGPAQNGETKTGKVSEAVEVVSEEEA